LAKNISELYLPNFIFRVIVVEHKSELFQNHLSKNVLEYGESYNLLNFPDETKSKEQQSLRDELLRKLSIRFTPGYNNSKIDSKNISPGCRICAEGTWSCLFISNKCNCRCFYCPSTQENEDYPTTNTIPFPIVNDYLKYIERFGFKGVSISGGEPLLTPEKTLKYIKAVRQYFGDSIYLWLYTNGTLLTDTLASELAEAGINEIRFDIGATDYSLEKLKKAINKIETVTVEIPALPDDFELMKRKIEDLTALGVKHLNLHQLRLTPFNFKKLVKKNYTFLHGEKITVLESELTALRLLEYTLDNSVNLPINYCSFAYKNRFQRTAARKRNAEPLIKDFEELTESGYIRTICITRSEMLFVQKSEELSKKYPGETFYDSQTKRLYMKLNLLEKLDWSEGEIFLKYGEAVMLPSISYRNPFRILNISLDKNIAVEYVKRYEKEFRSTRQLYEALTCLSDLAEDNSIIRNFERMGEGFQDYY
jgi:uncharacterized protein